MPNNIPTLAELKAISDSNTDMPDIELLRRGKVYMHFKDKDVEWFIFECDEKPDIMDSIISTFVVSNDNIETAKLDFIYLRTILEPDDNRPAVRTLDWKTVPATDIPIINEFLQRNMYNR